MTLVGKFVSSMEEMNDDNDSTSHLILMAVMRDGNKDKLIT
jgi:hypothetical protein